ncbi:MAG: Flp pilus assembly complex ATPase component TadA [Gammaproteobacteria bacterium]|nr:Flp pilus assembly complex ATPase component TadA [Gammaproteobacteria bacterium]
MAEILFPNEPSRFGERDLDRLLNFCVSHETSDVTIQSNHKVMAEIHGRLHRINKRDLHHSEVADLVNIIYGANGVAQILSGTDLDTHYEIRPERGIRHRFRVNITGCLVEGNPGVQITMRTIPSDPPYLSQMGLEPKLKEAIIPMQGIVIVAGATGSGKTTLLASIMREILEKEDGKILSYESPIEFVYDNVKSPKATISQSEIPLHLPNFPSAVRNALRRKPKFILVGEARDKETIAAVIDAALTGHTVYTTVHSNGVSDTIRRMVAAFPEEERYGRTVDLISLIRSIVWQMLVPTIDGKRAAIREWLIFTPEVRDALLESEF